MIQVHWVAAGGRDHGQQHRRQEANEHVELNGFEQAAHNQVYAAVIHKRVGIQAQGRVFVTVSRERPAFSEGTSQAAKF